MVRALIFAILLALPGWAQANEPIRLESTVYVERIERGSDATKRVLEKPERVARGDRLLFVLSFTNSGPAPLGGFSVTNPLPEAVRYLGPADDEQIVSVDGGENWGMLADLTVPMLDGSRRRAEPGDVTHIRWRVDRTLAAGASGRLIFRGTVR